MNKIGLGLSLATLAFGSAAAFAQPAPGRLDASATITREEALARAGQMFDRMDINKDGKLDRADREARRAERRAAMFDRLDTNKDGQISRAEFQAAGPAMGRGERGAGMGDRPGGERRWGEGRMGGPGMGGDRPMRMGGDMPMRMGGDMRMRMGAAGRDGAITRAEFISAAATRFDAADTNRDGKVTAEERQAARKAMRDRMQSMAPAGGPAAMPPTHN